MRRTKSQNLHPANKIAQAISGSYDVDKGLRFDGGGFGNEWDGVASSPAVPLSSANYNQWRFHDRNSISSNVWDLSSSGNPYELRLFDNRGGGAYFGPGLNEGDYTDYYTPSKIIELSNNNNLWISTEIGDEFYAYFDEGLPVVPGWSSVFLGQRGSENYVEFYLLPRFSESAASQDVTIKTVVDGDVNFEIIDTLSGFNIADGKTHSFNIHIYQLNPNDTNDVPFDQVIEFYLDGDLMAQKPVKIIGYHGWTTEMLVDEVQLPDGNFEYGVGSYTNETQEGQMFTTVGTIQIVQTSTTNPEAADEDDE